ncbi:Zinc finger MYM-type protein 3 [Nymphon striatum]|nr:Zinc finger MYM-type protein 3 [Nymphon striatum]
MNEFLGMYGYEKENQKGHPPTENNTESETVTPKPTPDQKEKPAGPSKRLKPCEECKEIKICKYQVMMQGTDKFIRTNICDDTCYTAFREKQKLQRNSAKRVTRSHTKEICNICSKNIKNSAGYVPSYGEQRLVLCSEVCYKKFRQQQGPKRKCGQCKKSIEERTNQGRTKCLIWETMEFCTEDCLSKYQNYLGSHCACCNSAVQNSSLGKFCVRFGLDIKQFCSNTCLEEFKKGLKVCTFCQKDISDGYDGFLAPVGDKGQFKDFCSQQCMEKYDTMNNPNGTTPKLNHCTVCHKLKTIKIEVDFEATKYELCSELCYAAFKYAHKVKPHKCDHCHKLFDIGSSEDEGQHTVQMDRMGKRFCSKKCLNIFVLSTRKIVPCSSCKVKKYNFDMIEWIDGTNQAQLFCSLNCLSSFKVESASSSSRSVKCNFCAKTAAAQYHLTMSDSTVRNFCCYSCVAKFQDQFPSGNFQKVSATNQVNVAKGITTSQTKSSSPAISNIITVSPQNISRIQANSFNRQGSATSVKSVTSLSLSKIPINRPTNSPNTPSVGSTPQTVIVKPPQPKMLKNKGTMCKPIMLTKGVSCRPHPCYKETQSDETSDGKIKYIPIPVPVYIPMPMHMYSMPAPILLPIPIPVPVPIFIPTTKNSAESIITSIQEIKERFEAKLTSKKRVLRIKPIQKSKSKNDDTNHEDSNHEDSNQEESNQEDSNHEDSNHEDSNHEDSDENEQSESTNDESEKSDSQDDPIEQNGETCSSPEVKAKSSVKRSSSNGSSHKNKKRQKIALDKEVHVKLDKTASNHENVSPKSNSSSIDLSGNLKYMYGVNAWKNWVINKNQQLEKASQSNRKLKLFKTNILQLSADELNYSLCLFMKEVRNPSGGEYDADSIYYLCLGIQQYLFLNNRPENIITDANFEKFTECLNDALSIYETKQQVDTGKFMARINAEILWESRQLGAHSPHVLLNTLLYFNTRYFGLKSVEDHMKMSFSQVVKTWKKSGKQNPSCLKYHPTNQIPQTLRGQKRKKEVLEQTENLDNLLRCPVKLYEFYLSKCPEAIKSRSDIYYLYPERSCIPDSPVWYSMQPLGKEQLNKMLQRAKMIKGAFNHT